MITTCENCGGLKADPGALLGGVKRQVSEILMSALNGQDTTLRTDDKKYIRWGLVEKRIHAAIDESMAATKKEMYRRASGIISFEEKEKYLTWVDATINQMQPPNEKS